MHSLGLALLVVAGVLGLATGFRYFRREAFMPYQAVVAGKSWGELDVGVQTIILGMLRVTGGAMAGCGAAVVCFCYALYTGERWAAGAILIVMALVLGPALYVGLRLRAFRPGAKPPIALTSFLGALVVVGVALSLSPAG